jgi:hypothetical protein
MDGESASLIQKVNSDDSIVACQQDAADFFDSIGQKRPCPIERSAGLPNGRSLVASRQSDPGCDDRG